MTLIPQNAFVDPRPFGLPQESIEIILDLPLPPSVNAIWRHRRGHVYKTKTYTGWIRECDAVVVLNRQYPRGRKIEGPFEFCLYLANSGRGDGDNRIKAVLDWLQSRNIVANDVNCRKGCWEWVPTREAPLGCRVHIRTLHNDI